MRVVNLRRANGHQATAADDAVLQEGDTLVLSGHPTALALAEDKLLRGWHGSPAPALPASGAEIWMKLACSAYAVSASSYDFNSV